MIHEGPFIPEEYMALTLLLFLGRKPGGGLLTDGLPMIIDGFGGSGDVR